MQTPKPHPLGLTVFKSSNTKHYERVKSLKVLDWEHHPPKGVSPP